MGLAENNFDSLEEISKKRSEWATLPVATKLAILDEIKTIVTKEMKYDDFKANGKKGAEMKGFNVNKTVEGDYEATYEAMMIILTIKATVDDMISIYKIRAGLAEPPKKLTKGNFDSREAINGQIVAKTFPIFPEDCKSFNSHFYGEVWFDSSEVQSESHVEAFAFEKAWNSVGKEGGLMIVLGAGNLPMLSFVDTFEALYIRNYVVYLKLHPIRSYVNEIFGRVFAPLISRGYMAIEPHSTNERSSAIVYHPEVDALHLTGGKATHDLLVWGADPKEQERNIKANTPKVKIVTSELGAVTPWVVVPGNYTDAELKSQAGILANFVRWNASCNCNAPKCVIVADDWEQKEAFLNMVDDEFSNNPLPVAYYPNIGKRWKKFSDQYPDCKKIESNTGMGIAERNLSAGGLHEEPLLLPYLKIETTVDLESTVGKEAASNEFVFNNEPFAPILAVVTLRGTSQNDLMRFSKTASLFCNDYLFGTLSGTITSPPSLVSDDGVQTLIAELKYGSICVNNWSGFSYALRKSGMWGAFPGETLDAVESGIGKIGNHIAIPHIEKFVVFSPIVHPSNMTIKKDLKKENIVLEAFSKYVLNSSTGNFIKFIVALIGEDLIKVGLLCTSVAVAGCAYLYRNKK